MSFEKFDLAIVGAGPSGLSAAVNATSEGLSTLVLEASNQVGGQSRYSAAIENYLGFPEGITGQQLANRAAKQVRKFGGILKLCSPVTGLRLNGNEKEIAVSGEWLYSCRALVIACGLQWRELDSLGTERFKPFVLYGGDKNKASRNKGKDIVIVGGGNSAGQAALHWSRFANVTLVCKYPIEKTMSKYLVERIREKGIKLVVESKLERLEGDSELRQCVITRAEIPCSKVIPFIGAVPVTGFALEVCESEESGFLTVPKCPGVFVVGDCREGSTKRIAVAVGEGSAVVARVHEYLSGVENKA